MRKRVVTFRAGASDHVRWRSAAAERGMSFSSWACRALEDALVVQRAEAAERRERDALRGAAYPQRAA